jgi:hypothetical protein
MARYDSAKRDTARIAGATRPLAADLSAPFGYYPIPPKIGLLGMLRPEQFFEQEGLFLTQPYDQKHSRRQLEIAATEGSALAAGSSQLWEELGLREFWQPLGG